MIKKQMYDEYRNSLLNIARLTRNDNSILIDFKIVGNNCDNTVYYIQRDGTKDLLKEQNFELCDSFYIEFLEKFILEYYDNMDVMFNDNIDINEDELYTYRVITEQNDMLSVDGISLDYAKRLMKLVNKSRDNIIFDNNKAIVTWNIAAILISGIGLSFIILSVLLS